MDGLNNDHSIMTIIFCFDTFYEWCYNQLQAESAEVNIALFTRRGYERMLWSTHHVFKWMEEISLLTWTLQYTPCDLKAKSEPCHQYLFFCFKAHSFGEMICDPRQDPVRHDVCFSTRGFDDPDSLGAWAGAIFVKTRRSDWISNADVWIMSAWPRGL